MVAGIEKDLINTERKGRWKESEEQEEIKALLPSLQ